MDKKLINSLVRFENFESINKELLKCKVAVHDYEQIANGTKFDINGSSKATPTLNYAPVIGYFNDGFQDHGVEWVIDNNGIKEVIKTVPFGVVIPNTAKIEKITTDNGETTDYLTCDCYLWTRYKEAIKEVKSNKCNQSMEVNVNVCEQVDNYLLIKEWDYSALCILGEDVSPAFMEANIRTANFSKEEFGNELSSMVNTIKQFMKNNLEEGGDKMAKKRKCTKCEAEIEVDYEFNENEEFICDSCKEDSDKEIAKFELSFDDIREKLNNLIRTNKDEWAWVNEVYADRFIYFKETWVDEKYTTNYYRQSYVIDGGEVKLVDDKVEVFTEFLTQEEIDKLELDRNSNKNKFKALESEVISLREFKETKDKAERKEKVSEIFSQYDEELTGVEGYENIKVSCENYSVEEIEEKCLLEYGKYMKLKNTKKVFSKEEPQDYKLDNTINYNADNNSAWSILENI